MSKPLSIFLLLAAASLTLWRGSEALIQLWKYLRLDTQLPAKIENWQIKERSPSKYALLIDYTYQYKGIERRGTGQWETAFYPNRYAALEKTSHLPSTPIQVWIDGSSPDYTALEKKFPWRPSLYAFSSLAILFYFIYLIRVN